MRSFALPLAALLVTAAAGVASAATPYDGNWSVLIVTQAGNCDTAYRYPLKIDNGRVLYGGDGSFTVSGRVAGSGAVNVLIALGEKKASGSGRLTARGGSGKWTGSTGCSGRWEAERRS